MPLPSEIPEWSVPDPADITDPAGLKSTGWQAGDPFLRQHANWLFKWISDWRTYIVDELIPDTFAPFFEEHASDGTHTDITADSAVFAGSIDVGDNATANSLVVTNSGTVGDDLSVTNNVTIGNALSVGDSITAVDAVTANSVVVNQVDTDEINEKTAAAGITVNNELILTEGSPYIVFDDGGMSLRVIGKTFIPDQEIAMVITSSPARNVQYVPGKTTFSTTTGFTTQIIPSGERTASSPDADISFSSYCNLESRSFSYADYNDNIDDIASSNFTADIDRVVFVADFILPTAFRVTYATAFSVRVITSSGIDPWEGCSARISVSNETGAGVTIADGFVSSFYSAANNELLFTFTETQVFAAVTDSAIRLEIYFEAGDLPAKASFLNLGYEVGQPVLTCTVANLRS